MDSLRWAQEELDKIDDRALRRRTICFSASGGKFEHSGVTLLNFASNDYLDFARSAELKQRANELLEEFGLGSGSSRLLSGTLPPHEDLERKIAQFLSAKSVLLFSSGYLTNLGLLSALIRREDVVCADRLCHASLQDGITLSRARQLRFHHNCADHAEELLRRATERRRNSRLYLVTESVFSMDGDLAPLLELGGLAARYDAILIIDEAHALGVFGRNGRGLIDACGISRDEALTTGTLSKAFGAYGGFVAGRSVLRELLLSTARPFIFNTSLPVSVLGGALAALELLERGPELGLELLSRAERFRAKLRSSGLNTLRSASQIVPVIVPGNFEVQRFSAVLREQGINAPAIRAPSVPKGSERLRFSLTLAHSEADLERVAEIVIGAAR